MLRSCFLSRFVKIRSAVAKEKSKISWVYWCFTSHATIFQSYMWRHRCASGLKKKLYLRMGSQHQRHFVGFFTAAAQIAYPIKFPNFPTKLMKYVHNLIEIYMYIGYRLGQRHRRSPAGVLVLRSCGTSQRIQYHFKVKLVNFWLFWYFLCIFPIKLMFASTLTPNMTVELPLIRKI